MPDSALSINVSQLGADIDNVDVSITAAIATSKLSGPLTDITGHGLGSLAANNDIANADVSATAAIDHSKLASLTSGALLVGDSTNVPTAVTLSGDGSLSDSGIFEITPGAVTSTEIGNGTVSEIDLSTDAVTTIKIKDENITTEKILDSAVTKAKLGLEDGIEFEGTIADDFETTFSITEPTADRTIIFPDASGTVALTSNVISTGDTASGDLTGTYPNPTISSNAISSTEITDGTIAEIDLATDAITSSKIADDTIESIDIKDATIADSDLAGSISPSKISGTAATLAGTETLLNKSLTSPSIDGASMSGTISGTPTFSDAVVLSQPDINGGTIDGATIAASDITVDATSTLDVSAGTLTLAGDQISGDNVEGGTIDAIAITTITSNTVKGTTFDTNVAAAGVTLSGTTLSADGTDTDINIAITPIGAGEVDISKIDIDGGTIDNTTIGSTTPGSGSFTTLSASGTVTLGKDGVDGSLKIYSEQGDPDYNVIFQPHVTMTQNVTYTLPPDDGTDGEVLKTDGSGALSWSPVEAITQSFASIDVNGGTIDGTTIATSNITVGDTRTLDVSAGTLTLAIDQISGDKVEGGTIAAIAITTLTSGIVKGTIFDTNVAAAGVTLSGTTLSADGTDTDINIAITPQGAGEVDISKVDIDGGAIDGTAVGANATSSGKFTTLTSSGTTAFDGALTVNDSGAHVDMRVEGANEQNLLFIDAGNDRIGIGTATPEFKLSLENDGGIIAKGTLNSGADIATAGAGTRLIWYPKKAAFRAGHAGTNLGFDDGNIGAYSVSFGQNTKASGLNSTAIGAGTQATAQDAFASGRTTTASGRYTAAFNYVTVASEDGATAFGNQTTASGQYATAFGFKTKAEPYASVVLGQYNIDISGTYNSWVSTDPLFVIGNGISSNAGDRSNAMTVLKNGKIGIVTASPGSELDVKGTLRLSGATSGYVGLAPAAAAGSTTYTLPSADGDSGQILSTNGSAALSWTSVGEFTSISGTSLDLNGNLDVSSQATEIIMKSNQSAALTIKEGSSPYMTFVTTSGGEKIQLNEDIDVDGGTIDDTAIGSATPSTGAFSTLSASGATTLNGNTTLGDADTDAVTIAGVLQGASPLVFEGATVNTSDLTFAITDPSASRTITFPDATGTVLLSSVDTAEISDSAVTSVKIFDGTISTVDIANSAITSAKIGSGAVTTDKIDNSLSTKTGTYTLTDSDDTILAAVSSDTTLTLPTAIGKDGKRFTIMRTSGGSPFAIKTEVAGQTIDGVDASSAGISISTNGYAITLISDGTGWLTVSEIGTDKIKTDAVSNTELANMTRGTVKVGGTSDEPTDLSAKTSGNILVGDGTDIISVAMSGDATLSSAGALTIAAGAVSSSRITKSVVSKTASYTITTSEDYILADATDSNIQLTLPPASGLTGRTFTIKRTDNSTNTVSIVGDSTDTIDGQASISLPNQYAFLTLASNGTVWYIVAEYAYYDITAPRPGNAGALVTVAGQTCGNLDVSWTKAVDDRSSQSNLQYLVYHSPSSDMTSLADAEANGTAVGSYAADIDTKAYTGLAGGSNYFTTVVKDEAGQRAIYNQTLYTHGGC